MRSSFGSSNILAGSGSGRLLMVVVRPSFLLLAIISLFSGVSYVRVCSKTLVGYLRFGDNESLDAGASGLVQGMIESRGVAD